MKRLSLILLVVFLFTALLPGTAFARSSALAGSCPPGFELHPYMDHSGEPMHIGLTTDLNGDGYICMRMISPNLHLHVDNFLP